MELELNREEIKDINDSIHIRVIQLQKLIEISTEYETKNNAISLKLRLCRIYNKLHYEDTGINLSE